MAQVVSFQPKLTLATRAERITRLWRDLSGDYVAGCVKIGAELIAAQQEHDITQAQLGARLQFSQPWVSLFMLIARNSIITQGNNQPRLPPNYKTLALLARLSEQKLEAHLANGTVHCAMTHGEARKLIPARKARAGKRLRARTKHQNDFAAEPDDDEQTIWRRGLMFRATAAISGAAFEEWSQFTTDRELVRTVRQAAEAWEKLAVYLERLPHGSKTKKQA
jgi:hypothetical protein